MIGSAASLKHLALLSLLLASGLALRLGAAHWIEIRNRAAGRDHEFADTQLYWMLGKSLSEGGPYFDGKRYCQRTPGYPFFLAGCFRLFGESTLAVRYCQAFLSIGSCLLVYALSRIYFDRDLGLVACAFGCFYPHAVMLSICLLSEVVFSFLLIGQVASLAKWSRSGGGRGLGWAWLAGTLAGAAALVRPSWMLATPAWVALRCVATAWKGNPQSKLKGYLGCLMILGTFLIVLTPWWIRNQRVTGHFVTTSLWVGASLFDGLNPLATGASNMEFMTEPERFGLRKDVDSMREFEQDRYLRNAAVNFALDHPGKAMLLSLTKVARYWNVVPNASGWRSGWFWLASALSCVPLFVLLLVGAWCLRSRREELSLMLGPVLYFCLIHSVFVSSIRYREAAMLPTLAVAAHGLQVLRGRMAAMPSRSQ